MQGKVNRGFKNGEVLIVKESNLLGTYLEKFERVKFLSYDESGERGIYINDFSGRTWGFLEEYVWTMEEYKAYRKGKLNGTPDT